MTDTVPVLVTFYTGEYAGAFEEVMQQSRTEHKWPLWFRTVDRMTFDDGWDAARALTRDGQSPDDPDSSMNQKCADAWGASLDKQRKGLHPYRWPDAIDDIAATITAVFISGTDTALFDIACRFAKVLQHVEVGGDDDTYDYFPDAMNALRTLCKAVGEAARPVYHETRAIAWANHYDGNVEYPTLSDLAPDWSASDW